jgi:small subunit ribosomal protein S19
MSRSLKKGPFVAFQILKKIKDGQGKSETIKTWSRSSTIIPPMIGYTFGVYNGRQHVPVFCDRPNGWSQTW